MKDDSCPDCGAPMAEVPWDNILDVLFWSHGLTWDESDLQGNVLRLRRFDEPSGEPVLRTVRLEREDPQFFALPSADAIGRLEAGAPTGREGLRWTGRILDRCWTVDSAQPPPAPTLI